MADVGRDGAPGTRGRHRDRQWTARAIGAQGASSRGRGLAVVAVLLGLSWVTSYALGGAGRVPPHWFYVPVLLAAARFGLAGAAATAVAAGLLAGPLLPLDVPTGAQQQLLDWTARLGFFLVIGLVMGAIIVRLKASLEHDRAKQEAERAKREAERANRAKSEFLSRMSHELRTPLNAILGFGQLLGMDGLEPRQQECVQQILRGGRHLLELINEVLDLSRIETGSLALSSEAVDVSELLAETLDLIRPLAAERELRIQAPSGRGCAGVVQADRQRLRQVLLNLASNAVKYNRHGGSIGFACKAADGRIRILVQDTGPGIPADKLRRLFTPFDRLGAEQSDVQGTGMGLALSKRFAEAMGGSLTAHSTEGQGSTFTLELAVAEDPLEHYQRDLPAQPASVHDHESGPERTVLCVEDNPSNLRLIQRVLGQRGGVRLLTATQGQLVQELARQHRPDLILLDQHLPDLGGEEVLRRLQADPHTAHLPVVMVSADATAGQIQRLLAAGASHYLTKPLDVTRFLEVVDQLLRAARRSP
jgi:signal transduction histidine kinase/CheY-like chemotaxis protein